MTTGTAPKTRILIAEDQALLSGSFRVLLDSEPDLITVGEAATGTQAITMARTERPDLVLMDIRMPELDGIEATRRICASPQTAGIRVLILTMFDLDAYVFAALRAGASGFLLKDTPPADLLNAIRVIAAGDALLTPAVTRRLIAEFCRHPAEPGSGPGLGSGPGSYPAPNDLAGVTDREREVLLLIANGLSNTEISNRLHLSLGTVKTHIGRLLTKLAARDRAQLVIAAYESGLVRPTGKGRSSARPRLTTSDAGSLSPPTTTESRADRDTRF